MLNEIKEKSQYVDKIRGQIDKAIQKYGSYSLRLKNGVFVMASRYKIKWDKNEPYLWILADNWSIIVIIPMKEIKHIVEAFIEEN